MAVRCVIVDDSRRFLMAARDTLESDGITVVGVAMDSADALVKIGELRPDVALIDVCLGGDSGFALAERVANATQRTSVILVSTYAESDFDNMFSMSAAKAFLPKTDISGAAVRKILGRA